MKELQPKTKTKKLTRRRLLQLVALGTAGAFLAACRRGGSEVPPLPIPEKTPNMKDLEQEMQSLFPKAQVNIQYLREGDYRPNPGKYQIDRYHLVIDCGNNVALTHQVIGIFQKAQVGQNSELPLVSEQLRRIIYNPEWSVGQPLPQVGQNPQEYIGVAVNGKLMEKDPRPLGTGHQKQIYLLLPSSSLRPNPYPLDILETYGGGSLLEDKDVLSIDASQRMSSCAPQNCQ